MSTARKQTSLLSIIMRYILLPLTVFSFAILLSRCGQQGPSPAPPYKGPSLVSVYQVNFDKSLNKLTWENMTPPQVTPANGGAGYTVSIVGVAPATYSAGIISQSVQITYVNPPPAGFPITLTGVVAVVDNAPTGKSTTTVNNPDYGNGYRADNPTKGPWTWWFKGSGTNADATANYGITSGGSSVAKTIAFNATASFSATLYIYAFCPSGVVVDRLNSNAAVANAFVMLGNSPGDSNYWAENSQPITTIVNYVPATDSQGYWAMPITTVIGNYMTITIGAIGSGTPVNPQYDNATLWATGFSNVVGPIRARIVRSGYVAVGDTDGTHSSLSTVTGISPGTCTNNLLMPAALATQAIGYEEVANINISTLTGPYFGKNLFVGTGCGQTDANQWNGMPSNLLVPAMNANNMTLYTAPNATTTVMAPRTLNAVGTGRIFFVPAPANATNFAFGGSMGVINYTWFLGLGSGQAMWNNPMPLTNVLRNVSFSNMGIDMAISTNTAPGTAVGFTTTGSGTNYLGTTLSSKSVALNNLGTIWGPTMPTTQNYDIVGSIGVDLGATQPADLRIVIPALTLADTSKTAMTISMPAAIPSGATLVPTAMILAVDALNEGNNIQYTPNTGTSPLANFSATVVVSDRTGYSVASFPASITFSNWYKFIELKWPTINANDQTLQWTSAVNAGVTGELPPSIGYMLVTYAVPYNEAVTGYLSNGVQIATPTIYRPAYAWEILFNPNAVCFTCPTTSLTIPTLPLTSGGELLTQGTYGRFHTVNILQGLAHTSINGPAYQWDTNNDMAAVSNYLITNMDNFSRIGVPIGAGWIITPATGANLGAVGTTPATAYIDAYNWKIVSASSGTDLRGCWWVNSVYLNCTGGTCGASTYYNWSSCASGTTACSSMPGVTVIANQYAYLQSTITLTTGEYNTITFTPYNTSAGTSTNGSPACQQVGPSHTINVKN